MPRPQSQLTAAEQRRIDRLLERQQRKQDELDAAKDDLDDYLASGDVSVPAVARYLGLTPEALYQRIRRRK